MIQEHIKKPLADEVLFGKLKNGGHVRVVVVKDEAGRDKLGFEYLDGPVTPKPEKIPEPAGAKPKRRRAAPQQAARPEGRWRRPQPPRAARCRRCRWSRCEPLRGTSSHRMRTARS